MANYRRRFTRDEFKKELVAHLADAPRGLSRQKLEEHAERKAAHYEQALHALDAVAERLKKLAETHPDETAKTDAEEALKQIDEAISAYGMAAMDQNSQWSFSQ